MSDLIAPGTLTDADVRAAQAVLDAWTNDPATPLSVWKLSAGDLLRLRGILAVQLVDVRAAGHLAGYEEGRRRGHWEARQAVLDALEDLL